MSASDRSDALVRYHGKRLRRARDGDDVSVRKVSAQEIVTLRYRLRVRVYHPNVLFLRVLPADQVLRHGDDRFAADVERAGPERVQRVGYAAAAGVLYGRDGVVAIAFRHRLYGRAYRGVPHKFIAALQKLARGGVGVRIFVSEIRDLTHG